MAFIHRSCLAFCAALLFGTGGCSSEHPVSLVSTSAAGTPSGARPPKVSKPKLLVDASGHKRFQTPAAPKAASGEVLVKFRASAVSAASARISARLGQATSALKLVRELLQDRSDVTSAKALRKRLPSAARLPSRSSASRVATPSDSVYTLHVAERSGRSLEQLVRELEASPEVEWAEPNYLLELHAVPNDALFSTQSHHYQMNAPAAWDVTTGSHDVVVAIIDTGVDIDHPDLAANIWQNPGEIAGDGIDNDLNGYIDDVNGWDFVSIASNQVAAGEDAAPPDNNPRDFNGHGTHVSGIVGAVGNNGQGTAGVAWQVSLMPLRAGYQTIEGGGSLQLSDVADALMYAADNGADIVNMSFGTPAVSRTLRLAIDYAVAHGVVLVGSAGNENSSVPAYPAAFHDVIAVAATDGAVQRASYSNFGAWVDLAVPGTNINSTSIGGGFQELTGTSMAAPIVAGSAALIKSAHPTWDRQAISRQLLGAALALDEYNEYHEGQLGAGRIDLALSVGSSINTPKFAGVSFHVSEQTGDYDGELEQDEVFQVVSSVRGFGSADPASAPSVSASLTTTDPFIDALETEALYDGVPFRKSVSNSASPFLFRVSPNAPADHVAEFQLSLSSGGASFVRSLKLPLQPSFRKPERIEVEAVFDKVVETLPDGRLLVILDQDASPQGIFATVRSLDGHWSPAQRLSGSAGNAHEPDVTLDAAGNVHVVYQRNVGSWDNEIFYVRYDAATDSWSPEEAVTTQAKIFGMEYLPTDYEIAVTDDGTRHVVWADTRSGQPELYYAFNSGSGFQEQAVAALPSNIIQFEAELVSLGGVQLRLFQKLNSGGFEFDCAAMHANGATWTSAHPVTCFYDALSAFALGGEAYRVVKQSAWASPLELARYNGTDWVVEQTLAANQTGRAGTMNTRMAMRASASGGFDLVAATRNDFTFGDVLSQRSGVFGSSQVQPLNNSQFVSYLMPQLAIDGDGKSHSVVDALHPMALSPSFLLLEALGTEHFTNDAVPAERLPTRPTVTDGGDTTADPTTLAVTFSSSHPAGIRYFEYAVGTAPGLADVRDWQTTTATAFSIDIEDTPLLPGQAYYVSARAVSNAVYSSVIGASDGIRLQDQCVPECSQKECGDDGCGGSCGTCDGGAICSSEGLCSSSCVSGAAWAPGIAYAVGDRVTFNGTVYKARQNHTSVVGWEPTSATQLWHIPNSCAGSEWAPQTEYFVGSQVSYQGANYEALVAHTSEPTWTPAGTPSLWQAL